jgi:hypothetical protein
MMNNGCREDRFSNSAHANGLSVCPMAPVHEEQDDGITQRSNFSYDIKWYRFL